MAEFILFNRLSVEIRLTIWVLAVRTDDKCAHFVTIKPYRGKIISIFGSRDELSAFNYDAGMWTACRESHKACLRAYRELQRKSMPGVMDPGTMHQFGIKGESEMVGTVLPRDLMVRVQQRDNYPLRNVGMHAVWSRMLPLTHGDIAIDYDPAWVTGYRRQRGRSFADVQMEGTALGFCVRLLSESPRPDRTIWLLDQHSHLPSGFRAGLSEANRPKEFYTCGGTSFIEVGADLWWSDEDILERDDDCSAFTFLSTFESDLWPMELQIVDLEIRILLINE